MRIFILMLLIPFFAHSNENFHFTNDDFNEMKWMVSNSFSNKTILIMDDYAKNLIEDYPPESHMLLVLGSQNLILSAALYNQLGKGVFNDYVSVAPFSRLMEYLESSHQDKFDDFMLKVIPNQETLRGRKIVITRLLQSGINMIELSGRIKNYLDENGISSGFDFYFSCNKYDIYDYFHHLQDSVNIRYDEDYLESCAFNDYLESTFKYNIYYPIYLDKVGNHFFKEWKGWEINPLFQKLVGFYKYKITTLRDL